MGIKAQYRTLGKLFTYYLIKAAVLWLVIVAAGFLLMNLLMSQNLLLPANAGEKLAGVTAEKILQKGTFAPSDVPVQCGYARFDADGQLLSSNLSKGGQKDAAEYLRWKRNGVGIYGSYAQADLPDGTTVLIHFEIRVHYTSPFLEQYFPSPSFIGGIYLLGATGLAIFLCARGYSRVLKRKLAVLTDATRQIGEQNLDFVVGKTGIRELDEVMDSFDTMRVSLKASLSAQWALESGRREQMTALAHDIKTPLTVMKGNLELLEEEGLTEDQRLYTGYIGKNLGYLEGYLQSLRQLTDAEISMRWEKSPVSLQKLAEELTEQAEALCLTGGIRFEVQLQSPPESLMLDYDSFYRALLNLVDNGVRFTPKGGIIRFTVTGGEQGTKFTVADSGRGFSEEELRHGAEQFYQGDKSRTSREHYGIGLYTVKRVAEAHDGVLALSNSRELGGACVNLILPQEPSGHPSPCNTGISMIK